MRVRITREPKGFVDGMALRFYHAGCVYDVPSELAEYLVADGFAVVEMRRQQRSKRLPRTDRRRDASHAR